MYHADRSRFEYAGYLAAATVEDFDDNLELVWSLDSKKLAFLTSAADADCNSGIVVFDVNSQSSRTYEYQSSRETNTSSLSIICHSNLSWVSMNKLQVDYEEYDYPESGRILDSEIRRGTGVIDLSIQAPSY